MNYPFLMGFVFSFFYFPRTWKIGDRFNITIWKLQILYCQFRPKIHPKFGWWRILGRKKIPCLYDAFQVFGTNFFSCQILGTYFFMPISEKYIGHWDHYPILNWQQFLSIPNSLGQTFGWFFFFTKIGAFFPFIKTLGWIWEWLSLIKIFGSFSGLFFSLLKFRNKY